MSALLPIAQGLRVLGDCLATEAAETGDERHSLLLARMSKAHILAAERLRQMATDQASGPGFDDRPQRGRRA